MVHICTTRLVFFRRLLRKEQSAPENQKCIMYHSNHFDLLGIIVLLNFDSIIKVLTMCLIALIVARMLYYQRVSLPVVSLYNAMLQCVCVCAC